MSEFKNTNNKLKSLLKKVDNMLKGIESSYFDVEDLILVCDYFIENNKLKTANDILNLGKSQHPDNTNLILLEAQVLSMQENFEKALGLIDKVQNIEPNNQDILLIKAEINSNKGNHKEAIKFYKIYLEKNPDEYIDMLYNDIAWEYEALKDYENALKYLKLALKNNPTDDTLLFEIAYFFEILEKHEESIDYYKEYLDENPYSYNAWYNLGNIYNDLELFEKAISAFDFAVIIKDDFSSAHFNKGNSYFKIKEYHKAIECYVETFKHEKNQAITYCYIGECFEKIKELDDAEKSYNFALEIDPSSVEALIGMTVIKDLQQKTAEGLPFIKKATTLFPSNYECWYILAEVNDKLERYSDALTYYEKAFSINKNNTQLTLDYTNFMSENTSIEEAIELISDNTDIKVKYRLVSYLLMIKKQNEAKAVLIDCLNENHSLHTDLLDYYPEIKEEVELMELINSYE